MTTLHRLLTVAVLASLALPGVAAAQGLLDGRHQPVNRRMPPGVPSSWVARTGGIVPGYYQPVRIETPGGTVTFYSGSPARSETADAPAQTAIAVGHVYRFRLAGIPDRPGLELYPTIELIGHLHPPRGRKDDFPVRVPIDYDDVDLALAGRMITKVIYLEQPQLASTLGDGTDVEVFAISPRINAVHEADRRGRPIAILRMGGRTPHPTNPAPGFFGAAPPIEVSTPRKLPGREEPTVPYVDPETPPGEGVDTEPPPADTPEGLDRQGWRLPRTGPRLR